ncbi:prepilin-type N-terminal cleavage/methylation domain-containing protein [Azoarcus sp. TTM-91]|uniref:prepilin-type N-terminal cleavage/methylation domain-containing protein n=1 Tax=Azoarcus sp. TTM-91 TaxID=2691581 RepID=UPI00145EE97D|nr:prepilin-type N-terminal cleavage/methylation domain-containing protein [Azoarcus sp. TTM-91]NMG37118.1 prepilin-type N-terminal cleavage/methylation domain-containing protein [Azoarcus sp. TTM-91]
MSARRQLAASLPLYRATQDARQARPASPRAPHGFTLVEVVIALSLVSLIMLGLVSALGGFGATASRLDERAGRAGDAWLVGGLLRTALSTGVRQLKQTLPDGSKVNFFRGDAAELSWLGTMPARYGSGGLHRFRLAAAGSPPRLLLQYLPYTPDTGVSPPVDETASVHVLVEALDGLRIAYQSRPMTPAEEALWSDSWTDPERLPERVRLDIAAAGEVWPPLFITITGVDNSDGLRLVNTPSAR